MTTTPNNIPDTLVEAQQCYDRQDFLTAIQLTEHFLNEATPDQGAFRPHAFETLILAAARSQNRALCMETLNHYKQQYPKKVFHYYMLSELYWQTKEIHKIFDLMIEAYQALPVGLQMHKLLEKIFSEKNMAQAAYEYYQKRINEPDNLCVALSMVSALIVQHAYPAALRFTEQILAVDKKQSVALSLNWHCRTQLNAIAPYYSQHGQDAYLHQHYFQDQRNGIFLNIGAHNGVAGDNTYFFEKNYGWDGACIEASPVQFEQLKKNRRCLCLNYCLTNERGKVDFLHVKTKLDQMSGILSSIRPENLDTIKRENCETEIIPLEGISLDQLIHELKFPSIDFCSLDIEGVELELLRHTDFSQFNIPVFLIENNNPDNDELKDLMKTQGYRLDTTIGFDELYIKQ